MRDLDDEIGTVQRREPVTQAFRPVIAATHAGPGDAHDRAEHHVTDAEDQRQDGETA